MFSASASRRASRVSIRYAVMAGEAVELRLGVDRHHHVEAFAVHGLMIEQTPRAVGGLSLGVGATAELRLPVPSPITAAQVLMQRRRLPCFDLGRQKPIVRRLRTFK